MLIFFRNIKYLELDFLLFPTEMLQLKSLLMEDTDLSHLPSNL